MTKQATVFPLRLPNSLKVAVAKICMEDGTSINQFVTTAVAEKISATKIGDSLLRKETMPISRRRAVFCGEMAANHPDRMTSLA